MDEIQRSFYHRELRIAFLENKGAAFERLFSKIMTHAYSKDFQTVRPYGNQGDLKCDGFLKNKGTVYQCYAPDSIILAVLLKKIDEDFNGAVAHWGDKMKCWCFVHNDDRGLPAEAVQKLNDLHSHTPSVVVEQMSYAEIFAIAIKLPQVYLEDLFGVVPTSRTFDKLNFAALKPVILGIQREEPGNGVPVRPPSSTKLQANDLSEDTAILLTAGRRRERLVEQFFEKWPEPEFGEEIAEGFRKRYHELRSVNLTADEIFSCLQDFAGGMDGPPTHQSSVLAVLCYFFERCDIFEDHEREKPG